MKPFDNGCLRSVFGRRRRDRVQYDVPRHRFCAFTPRLLPRRLRWFGDAARRPAGEIIRSAIDPVPPKTWLAMLADDLIQMRDPNVVSSLRR